jgi:hypothetical protein
MVRSLKTSHARAVHHYAPHEQYHDFHDGDTDDEIEMEPAPMVFPNLIMVPDDEEDPEEMIPEEDEPAEQPNQEEQAPGEELEDHLDQEVEEEEQEQEEEEVIWEMYHYMADGVGIPMADHLRVDLGMDRVLSISNWIFIVGLYWIWIQLDRGHPYASDPISLDFIGLIRLDNPILSWI